MNGNKSIVAEFSIIPTTPTTRVWNGSSSANGNWTTSQNWNEGRPNAGDALLFPAGASRLANSNDFAAQTTFKSITFGGANYVLSGSPINLTDGVVATNSSGTNTVNLAMQLNSNQTFRCAVPSTKLIIAGNVALGSRTLTADGAGDLALPGIISGTGGILKTNAGTSTLSGNNTFTGTNIINGGRLNVNGSQPASAVLANSSGTLGGTGRVGVISCAGTVSPGSSPGVFLSSNVTFLYKLGSVSISSPHPFPVGTNVVVVTATNGVPRAASCSFTVMVTDREPPTIQCPSNITVTAAGACPQVVSFSQNTFATDNCSRGNLIASPASGSAFPLGTNVVSLTATDPAGNTNFCSFLVTVLPGPAPKLAIRHSGNVAVVLSWPASNGCYQLRLFQGLGPRTVDKQRAQQ